MRWMCAGLLIAFAPWLSAQDNDTALAPPPMRVTQVESHGEATVYGPPGYVEFNFEKTISDGNFETSTKTLIEFAATLRDTLTNEKLKPSRFDAQTPVIPDMTRGVAKIAIRMQYDLAELGPDEAMLGRLGQICKQLNDLAQKLQVTVGGPIFDTAEPESLVGSAVSVALANAYPAAEAASTTLGLPIDTVARVEVLGTEWNKPNRFSGNEPSLGQIACTAKVRVVYNLAPPAPQP